MNILAIIPARGGSKRIPYKNIKDFLGQPIIKYTVDSAVESQIFDEVMVSTDDPKVAKIAREFGASIPFLRTKHNSSDMATIADVITEVLEGYHQKGKEFDYFCCVLPAVPTISSKRIKLGLDLLRKEKADAVLPLVKFDYPIQRALRIERANVEMIEPKNANVRSQDLEATYHDAGRFYWARTKSFLEQKTLFMRHMLPIIIPSWEVQDIDTPEDWKIAEIKYKIKEMIGEEQTSFYDATDNKLIKVIE
ncbi:MAG: pseudaminic acid cytidylyltransferase [Patescibacteria group bacterium]